MDNRETAGVVCIGGAVVDRKFHLAPGAVAGPVVLRGAAPGPASLRARAVRGFGGVACNVAGEVIRRGIRAVLVSFAGDDDDGDALLRDLARRGIDGSWVTRVAGVSTAQYVAVLDADGELVLEVADTAIFERFSAGHVAQIAPHLAVAAWVFADANLPPGAMAALAARACAGGDVTAAPPSYRLAVDAVSVPLAALLPAALDGIDLLFLNEAEARAYLAAHAALPAAAVSATGSDADACACVRAVRAHGAAVVVMTRGSRGALVATEDEVVPIAAAAVARVVDVTGAGDALIAGTLVHLLARDDPRAPVTAADARAAVAGGMRGAALTIAGIATSPPNRTPVSAFP